MSIYDRDYMKNRKPSEPRPREPRRPFFEDDDDEIRRRVYNIVKRMKEIKNNERIKKLQKDF